MSKEYKFRDYLIDKYQEYDIDMLENELIRQEFISYCKSNNLLAIFY